jgi:protein SCO1/2
MTTTLSSQGNDSRSPSGAPLTLLLLTALLVGFGGAMLLISAAYLQDLRMLSAVPELVWAFVCGVPTGEAGLLPLFITLALVAFFATGLLWLTHMLRTRARAQVAYAIAALMIVVLVGGVLIARSAANASALAVATPAPVPGITYLQTPRAVQNFALPATTGRTMRLSDFAGTYTMLFFGYTHCPDICPMTMFEMRRMVEMLEGEMALNVLFVSVDGARDTTEALATYLERFNPSFVGMSGDPVTLSQMTPDYALAYRADAPDAEGNYSVEHTTPVFVIDPQGRLTAIIGFGTPAEQMVEGLRSLVSAQSS